MLSQYELQVHATEVQGALCVHCALHLHISCPGYQFIKYYEKLTRFLKHQRSNLQTTVFFSQEAASGVDGQCIL